MTPRNDFSVQNSEHVDFTVTHSNNTSVSGTWDSLTEGRRRLLLINWLWLSNEFLRINSTFQLYEWMKWWNMTGARFTLKYLCSLSYPDKMTHRLVNIIVWLIYLVVSCFSWIHRFDLRISSNQQINTHQKHQESKTERRYSADCSTSTSTVTLLKYYLITR